MTEPWKSDRVRESEIPFAALAVFVGGVLLATMAGIVSGAIETPGSCAKQCAPAMGVVQAGRCYCDTRRVQP